MDPFNNVQLSIYIHTSIYNVLYCRLALVLVICTLLLLAQMPCVQVTNFLHFFHMIRSFN
jgi:hypothetical protein